MPRAHGADRAARNPDRATVAAAPAGSYLGGTVGGTGSPGTGWDNP
ncbi:hypothetical protein [Bordetella genomosp. 9]|nr:hypothetical protein [Bordetella genomosp. 9]